MIIDQSNPRILLYLSLATCQHVNMSTWQHVNMDIIFLMKKTEEMYSQPKIPPRAKLREETDPSLSAAATGRDQSGGDR